MRREMIPGLLGDIEDLLFHSHNSATGSAMCRGVLFACRDALTGLLDENDRMRLDLDQADVLARALRLVGEGRKR